MSAILTSDLHLNSRSKDAYRWQILPWLDEKAHRRSVDLIIVTGDLTDDKDRHAGSLVNRIVEFLHNSKNQWVFVSGNHDYFDPNSPFFGFLNCLENVRWITKPRIMKLAVEDDYTRCLLLPATKEWATEWPQFFEVQENTYDYIFMHGTFEGTLSETGYALPGIPLSFFDPKRYGRIFAGDVHVPGKIGDRIESIGSPYRVRFGDTYTPRVINISDKGEQVDLHPNIPSRHVLNIRRPEDFDKFEEVCEGDQIKIRVRMKLADMIDWRNTRKEFQVAAERRGWFVHGIEPIAAPVRRRLEDKPEEGSRPNYKSPEDHVRDYVGRMKLGQPDLDFGLRLLQG